MTTYNIIDSTMEEKNHIHLAYLKIECEVCHHSWGVPRPEQGQELTQRQITCEECLYRERNKN